MPCRSRDKGLSVHLNGIPSTAVHRRSTGYFPWGLSSASSARRSASVIAAAPPAFTRFGDFAGG